MAGFGVVVGVDPHHGTQAAVAGTAMNFLPRLRRLSDEQLEVMLTLRRLTQGSVYLQGASIHEFRGCWPSDSSSTIDELVDDLVLGHSSTAGGTTSSRTSEPSCSAYLADEPLLISGRHSPVGHPSGESGTARVHHQRRAQPAWLFPEMATLNARGRSFD